MAYIILYAIRITHGFVLGAFNQSYTSIILAIFLIDGLRNFVESFSTIGFKSSTESLNRITVVIACKDGEDVLEATLDDLLKRFKPKRIIVASNGSTDRTCDIAKQKGVVCLEYKQPLGKVRAINAALEHVKTPYTLLLDDDTLIGSAKMPTGLLESGYEGVAFRVLVNTSTWVTKFQQYEYRKSSDIGKRYHNRKASVQNISGAIGLFKTSHLLRQINRHTGEFSGEDLQRTLLVHLTTNAKGVVLSRSTVHTSPPKTLITFLNQRIFGWYPGLYANFKNYSKILTRDRMPPALRFDAFYNIVFMMLFDILRFLTLPILVLYPWYFLVMYLFYLLMDLPSYVRNHSETPFLVYLAYPLYGLVGFMTRVCAFAAFVYRRLVVKLERRDFLDDYRVAPTNSKVTAAIGANVVVATPLVANVLFNYLPYIFKFYPHF